METGLSRNHCKLVFYIAFAQSFHYLLNLAKAEAEALQWTAHHHPEICASSSLSVCH